MKEVFMFTVFLNSLNAFAQATNDVAAVAPPQAPAWMQFVPFVIIIGVFYFYIKRFWRKLGTENHRCKYESI